MSKLLGLRTPSPTSAATARSSSSSPSSRRRLRPDSPRNMRSALVVMVLSPRTLAGILVAFHVLIFYELYGPRQLIKDVQSILPEITTGIPDFSSWKESLSFVPPTTITTTPAPTEPEIFEFPEPRRKANTISPMKTDIEFPTLTDPHTKVIFYHIYLPSDALENALRIVQEQLRQLGGKQVTLFYNTIGSPPPPQIKKWCLEYNLTACHHLAHYDSAYEEHTLQTLYQYCNSTTSTQRVGYLHNKGSHHASEINEAWRYQMTDALVRDDCWSTASNCNVCGLFFTTDRGLYMSGNVWTATCSYARDLIPPDQFAAASDRVLEDALLQKVRGQFQFTQYSQDDLYFGTDRYAAEWWIGSHPRIRPCDYSGSISDVGGYDRTKDFLAFVQTNTTPTVFTPEAPAQLYKVPKPRQWRKLGEPKSEYFLLAGRIHRWLQLYKELPPAESWVWTHYPRGKWWRGAVKVYGMNVLDTVLSASSAP